MITLSSLHEMTKGLNSQTPILVSCFTKEYTRDNLTVADCGSIIFDGSDSFVYCISSRKNNDFTLADLRKLLEEYPNKQNSHLYMIDDDYCNEVELEDVLIKNGKIILI